MRITINVNKDNLRNTDMNNSILQESGNQSL